MDPAAATADLADENGVLQVLAGACAPLAEVGRRWAPEFEEIRAEVGGAGLDPVLADSLAQALRGRLD
jgi:hypothetical protein